MEFYFMDVNTYELVCNADGSPNKASDAYIKKFWENKRIYAEKHPNSFFADHWWNRYTFY